MSVESKLDAILAGQQAILQAVKDQPGTTNQAVVDGLSAIKSELDQVNTTLGAEAPAGTPQPTQVPT